jgi:guanosine-3',5'-bis(diphosphate) 3'-pyrophosphohydrolase
MVSISELVQKIKKFSPDADTGIVEKAYELAAKYHKGQTRLSGDPYITHPLAVAEILVELEQDLPTIAASLLHDIIEDASVERKVLIENFGEEIVYLVEGVTKLGKLVFESREERQAENFRKMLLAMGEDVRVIIIKLADRLHNMQTLKYLPKD